jgi:diacylglycerol kinase (ATP)
VSRDRAVFLVNPASDNGATGKHWAELERRARTAGLEGESRVSTRPGEIAKLAEEAAHGAALLVAVGGDGTVHEAVNGLLRAGGRPDLAVLPRGTSEDFARALGIPTDWEAAVRVAKEGATRTIDAGHVRYSGRDGSPEEAYFASMAGVGMSGAVARRLNTTTKALGGKVSGLLATFAVFRRWQNVEMTVEVDGERRHGLTEDVLVANTRFHNGGMRLCPDADPDDGLFDVLLIGDVSKRDLILTLPKLYRGTHLPHPKAELLRGSRVKVDAAEPLPIELDGEQPGTTPARFEVLPRALRLRVPSSG